MDYISLLFLVLFGSAKKAFQSIATRKYLFHTADHYAGNGLIFGIMAIFYLPMALAEPAPSLGILLLGAAYGLDTLLFQFATSRAISTGSVSISILISCFSLIIPILYGVIFANETLMPLHIVGMVILFLSFFLSVKPEKGSDVTLRWVIYVTVSFLTGGLGSILAKFRVMWMPEEPMLWFLFSSYATATLLAYLMTLYTSKKASLLVSFKIRSKALLWFGGAAVSLTIFQILSQKLTETMPVSILNPVQNGGMIVVSMLFSMLFFHEKLTKVQWFSVVAGCASVVLLCL